MTEMTCPFCEYEFLAETWCNGDCPKCGNWYEFDEVCTEDYSDCWMMIDWDWDKLVREKPEKG